MYFILVITAISAIFVNRSAADYNAAVVEFDSTLSSTPSENLEYNLNEYIVYIEQARIEKVKIIVFPEYGLTSPLVEPSEYAIEIPELGKTPTVEHYHLKKISNAAIEYNMYIIVNLLEKAKNPKNVTIYYNTNIAFDKKGVIVAKYRKINLFKEPKITPGDKNQNSAIFDSDLGATFGIINFSDMLYYNPSRTILKSNITDVICPTAWTSYLPFYHSLSIQLGYAMANKVNLLAPSLNNASAGIGGSGIYGKDGTVYAAHIAGVSTSKLLVANINSDVPIYTPFRYNHLGSLRPSMEPEIKSFKALTYFTPSKYVFRQVDLTQSKVYQKLCDGSFCCNFNLTVSPGANTSEIYQLLAFQGKDELDKISHKRRICAILACESTDVKTCGSRNVTISTSFAELSISSSFKDVAEEFYIPILMRTDLTLILNTKYSDNIVNGTRTVSLKTTHQQQSVVVFGILGRGGSSAITSSFVLLIVVTYITYAFK